jgi:hypothetical protein
MSESGQSKHALTRENPGSPGLGSGQSGLLPGLGAKNPEFPYLQGPDCSPNDHGIWSSSPDSPGAVRGYKTLTNKESPASPESVRKSNASPVRSPAPYMT